jgi:hypothetical protein
MKGIAAAEEKVSILQGDHDFLIVDLMVDWYASSEATQCAMFVLGNEVCGRAIGKRPCSRPG